ncbi:uncharacterized protein [Chironomus tepperi]|uniref:uncharacterized protein n=1 Tax=Chironomus tepperi TaxID=113505 RepID=UPI00391F59F9
MSAILISSTSNVIPKSHISSSINNNNVVCPPIPEEEKVEEETEIAREERKQTGRSIAIIIFLSLMCLALYHVIQRKTTILAGVLVPALILFTYTFFVIHISSRDKKRRKRKAAEELELSLPDTTTIKPEAAKTFPTTSNVSTITPITSGKQFSSSTSLPMTRQLPTSGGFKPNSSFKVPKNLNDPNVHPSRSSDSRKNPPTKDIKKIPSQPQVKLNQSAQIAIENEVKKSKIPIER